jgi:hypothetical protein
MRTSNTEGIGPALWETREQAEAAPPLSEQLVSIAESRQIYVGAPTIYEQAAVCL